MIVLFALGALTLASGAGERWGWPGLLIALPVGFCGLLGLLYLVLLAIVRLERGRLPECESGLHRGEPVAVLGDYESMPEGDEHYYRCPCGHEYAKAGRRFLRRRPDGTLAPYMVWKLLRGYVRDPDAR